MTFLLGPNGAGKTAILQALARMFVSTRATKIRRSDFHVPANEVPTMSLTRNLWIEADFEFPELEEDGAEEAELPAVPGNFAHMQLVPKMVPPRSAIRSRRRSIIR